MKKLLIGATLAIAIGVANADTVAVQTPQTSPPKKTIPTVQLPPSDPNAGDASAYTLPGDGLTSSADNAELGRQYQEKMEANKALNPPPPPKPVPDQNSY
jgi:hypothetical protein